MKRVNAQPIGLLVRDYLRQTGLETPLNERRLVESWPEVVGKGCARFTGNLFVKNEVLYVHLKSSVLRQELMMGREMLVKRLNEYVGANVIRNIVFR